MSRIRTHSDNMIRQVSSSRGALRIMPPATAILVVLTVILHMTVGGGAALRPQDKPVSLQDSVRQLADYESQPYIDSNFNRNADETTIESTLSTSLTGNSEPQATSVATEETQAVETSAETQETAESIIETTEETIPEPEFEVVDQTLYLAADKVNLRSEPNTSSEILNTLSLSSQLRRTEVSEEWSYVTDTNGQGGYLMNKFLTEVKPEPKPTPTPAPTQAPAPVVEQPSVQSPVTPSPGSIISPEQQQQMVNLARSYLGVRYQTPCNAPTTFDCSGFTRYINLTMFGVNLPYTTTGQIVSGIGVSLSDIQIGDIICFDWNRDGGCDHVGLYVGGGQYVHASQSRGMVVEGTISGREPIIAVRRIIY